MPPIVISEMSRLTRRSAATAGCFKGACNCGDHAWADATKGYVVIVDTDDAHLIRDHHWRAQMRHRTVYAVGRCADGKSPVLHRVILGADPSVIIDHREGNGLDNRKRMLRKTTTMGNAQGYRRRSGRNTSGITGVSFKKQTGAWVASICANRRQIWLGSFQTKEAAEAAYLEARRKYHGQ